MKQAFGSAHVLLSPSLVDSFDRYREIYERIFQLHEQGKHTQWHVLFDDTIQQSDTPYQLLYMFLDHTISTSNRKKQRMIVPLIEQFKRQNTSPSSPSFDDRITQNILAKICRRCLFSQLEAIVDVFHLRTIANRSLLIDFIDEQIAQRQDIVFVAHMTSTLKLLEPGGVPLEKVCHTDERTRVSMDFVRSWYR